MNITNMKNIIVLKNLPSNMVEEAFVVLKENARIRKFGHIDKAKSVSNKKDTKDYIVKEAEMVIHNYISDIEKQKNIKNAENIIKKYKKLKAVTIFFAMLLLVDLVIKII